MTFDLKCSIIYVYQVVGGVSYSVGKLDYIDFTRYEIVRFLILNRVELETSAKESDNSSLLTSEDIICIYTSLDELIDRCEFNNKRTELIKMLFSGKRISDLDGKKSGNSRIVSRIIQDINNRAIIDKKVWCVLDDY